MYSSLRFDYITYMTDPRDYISPPADDAFGAEITLTLRMIDLLESGEATITKVYEIANQAFTLLGDSDRALRLKARISHQALDYLDAIR